MMQTDLYSFSYKKGTLVPWCKSCSCQHSHRDGKTKAGKQRYECQKCGFRFVWTSDLPRRNFFSNVIMLATELYGSVGISLRTISKKFMKYFDIKISHEGVRKWVKAATEMKIIDDKSIATNTWHADETYVKIKGKGFWLWVIYCRESKQVIAWHISDTHLLKDALAVFAKAKKVCHGVRPKKIVTDKLWQYPVAIYKTFGWSWSEHWKRHVVDSGIGKNALIERVNREIKRRYKWFGTFQALDGANAFFHLFFYHFNQRWLNSSELT
jgi:transposase-like protein